MASQQTLARSPGKPSDEATEEQLRIARQQGDAFGRAVDTMANKEAHGEQAEAGDYVVGYAVEKAEGMYHMQGGELHWQNPHQDENCHIEVVVRDRHDGRFIPELNVMVTVIDGRGEVVGRHRHEFLWHPWLYHYGRNWHVPKSGTYRLAVRIEPPTFMRHDKVNGKRFAEPVEVEWQKVEIETGQKMS